MKIQRKDHTAEVLIRNSLERKYRLIAEKATDFLIHPDEVRDVINLCKDTFKNGNSSREGRYRHKNGQWFWFEIKATRLLDEMSRVKIFTIA